MFAVYYNKSKKGKPIVIINTISKNGQSAKNRSAHFVNNVLEDTALQNDIFLLVEIWIFRGRILFRSCSPAGPRHNIIGIFMNGVAIRRRWMRQEKKHEDVGLRGLCTWYR